MKKLFLILLSLVLTAGFSACSNNSSDADEKSLTVYSFSGENDQFAVSNGVIVISDDETTFFGGKLSPKSEDFDDVASCSTTFYTITGNEKKIILSNSVSDMTGEAIEVWKNLGKVTGDGIIAVSKEELKDSLYLEITTKSLNGEETSYDLKLSLTEVVD